MKDTHSEFTFVAGKPFQLQAARQRISRDTQLAFVSRDTIEVAEGVELRLTDANPYETML